MRTADEGCSTMRQEPLKLHDETFLDHKKTKSGKKKNDSFDSQSTIRICSLLKKRVCGCYFRAVSTQGFLMTDLPSEKTLAVTVHKLNKTLI